MTWLPIREAAAQGRTSRATWKRRVAGGWPSYLEADGQGGPGLRMVWVAKLPPELLGDEVVRLRELVEEIMSRQTSAPPALTEVLSPRPIPKRPAQPPPGPRPLRPVDASDVPGWRDAWGELVRREGSISGAGRLLGVGQPAASRWTNGRRKPQAQTQRRIVELAELFGSAQGDGEQREAA